MGGGRKPCVFKFKNPYRDIYGASIVLGLPLIVPFIQQFFVLDHITRVWDQSTIVTLTPTPTPKIDIFRRLCHYVVYRYMVLPYTLKCCENVS